MSENPTTYGLMGKFWHHSKGDYVLSMMRRNNSPQNVSTPDPGTAKVSEIAVHWCVCETTARAALLAAGLKPSALCPERYRWSEIWRLEGLHFVPLDDFAMRKG